VLRALIADRIAFARAHPAIVKVVVQEMLLRPAFREATLPVFRNRVLPVIGPVFERARASGEIGDYPVEVALRTVASILLGYVILTTVVGPAEGHDDEAEVERLTQLIMGGLAGGRPPA
jgi:hypothetical protein